MWHDKRPNEGLKSSKPFFGVLLLSHWYQLTIRSIGTIIYIIYNIFSPFLMVWDVSVDVNAGLFCVQWGRQWVKQGCEYKKNI